MYCLFLSLQVKTSISQKNIQALQQLNGSDILLEVCANLVHLKRYQLYYSDAVQRGEFTLPSTLAEAVTARSSVQQVRFECGLFYSLKGLHLLLFLDIKEFLEIFASSLVDWYHGFD